MMNFIWARDIHHTIFAPNPVPKDRGTRMSEVFEIFNTGGTTKVNFKFRFNETKLFFAQFIRAHNWVPRQKRDSLPTNQPPTRLTLTTPRHITVHPLSPTKNPLQEVTRFSLINKISLPSLVALPRSSNTEGNSAIVVKLIADEPCKGVNRRRRRQHKTRNIIVSCAVGDDI